MSKALEVSAATFAAEVEQATVPVLVDFWAEWCMPCRMIAPHIDDLSNTYAGKIKFVKVNVDNEPNLAGRFDIVSIPTMMVFHNGQMVRQRVGGLPKHEIENMFKDLV
ncbi:MAG: thioredoxin [Spirochaetes bacterium]|nr:thioredoxin [Spirochaetota bacterium]MBU0954544.1 thioredoxin [Spirochaetota bacterium]